MALIDFLLQNFISEGSHPRLGGDGGFDQATRTARGSIHHFNASDDRSTVTPGPMVELTEIFCR